MATTPYFDYQRNFNWFSHFWQATDTIRIHIEWVEYDLYNRQITA